MISTRRYLAAMTATIVQVSIPLLSVQAETVALDTTNWTVLNGTFIEHMGRPAFQGTAILKGVEFTDGVLEVDMAMEHVKSYPGLIWRQRPGGNYKRFYIRPHRSGHYPDALQYTPSINGIDGWQLYSGDGFTSAIDALNPNEWIHVRIEVSGTQARVYVGNGDQPDLEIDRLQHGNSSGAIGLFGPIDGSAFFSNFSYETSTQMRFEAAPEITTPFGMLMQWELSQPFDYAEIDIERTPSDQGLEVQFDSVTADLTGLVDVARYHRRIGGSSDWVFARATIHADSAHSMKLSLGYSDYVTVFLNNQLLFTGISAYQSRDASFAGILGLYDYVQLPLQAGPNELILAVGESFGGWGFKCQDGNAVFLRSPVTEVWRAPKLLGFPESALYDENSGLLYVSCYLTIGEEYIARVTLTGDIQDQKWATGLNRPTGMCLSDGSLFAVERTNLVEIDTSTGEIIDRYRIPESIFPNDVTVDHRGNLYISDIEADRIYRFTDGVVSIWMEGNGLDQPNGLIIDGDRLLVGNTGDQTLKGISLADQSVVDLVKLDNSANLDGIKVLDGGEILLSDFFGRVFRVSNSGEKTLLIDVSATGLYCADFEYIANQKLLIVPGLYDGSLRAYRLGLDD